MYTLEITPDEWGLVYNSGPHAGARWPAWADALINSPLWSDKPDPLTIEQTATLVEAFRADAETFDGLDKNTILSYKLYQLWTDFDLDRAEENE